MTRAAGRVRKSRDDANGSTMNQGRRSRPGTERLIPVKDRWISRLIELASDSPYEVAHDLFAGQPGPPLPNGVEERVQQAVRWGLQERELEKYERELSRRTTLGEFLSWARTRKGCTEEELGQRAGISAECIRALEKDQICPLDVAPEHVARVAAVLDVSVFTLLERLQAAHLDSESRKDRGGRARPPSADPSVVWSSGARRARQVMEFLCLRRKEPQYVTQADLDHYCGAVYRAWKEQREDPAE